MLGDLGGSQGAGAAELLDALTLTPSYRATYEIRSRSAPLTDSDACSDGPTTERLDAHLAAKGTHHVGPYL